MKKFTAEQIYKLCRHIVNRLEASKQAELKECGDDYEVDAALELEFKRPDGTHVHAKISSIEDVLEFVEKHGYCDAEELAKVRKMIEQDDAKTSEQKACEELNKAYAELRDTFTDLNDAQAEYERACDRYEKKRLEIIKRLFGENYPRGYADYIKKPWDLERVLRAVVKGD